MLILGDLACPSETLAYRLLSDMKETGIFDNQLILCNLEGLFAQNSSLKDEKLFNVKEVLRAFDPGRTIFSLANNHTYDYPESIMETERVLRDCGFHTVGVKHGPGLEPTIVSWRGVEYAFFAHCWNVYTRTNPNKVNNVSIVDDDYSKFVDEVASYTRLHARQRVVCYFHWNYDLEELPFPMHREIAMTLIASGVYAVIGGHSHIPQGGELIDGRPAVYGLGNFYIPSGNFFDGVLRYPDASHTTMVVDINDESAEVSCHWFKTDDESVLSFVKTERFDDGELIGRYSPYRGMGNEEYLSFFKKNRTKGALVPVFSRYRGVIAGLKQFLAVARIKLIKAIKR